MTSGKNVKTGTGTSVQCGTGRRADSIKIEPIFLLALIPTSHIYHAKITIFVVIFGFPPYHRNPEPHESSFTLDPTAQRFCTLLAGAQDLSWSPNVTP